MKICAHDKHISDGVYIIASKINNQQTAIKYYHQNHIGSTALLTDNSGSKYQQYYYMPYGSEFVTENPGNDEIERLFTGQVFDKESGLYYYNARYYDPDLTIFMRPDPAMDGFNHYGYCNANPVMYNDPTGKFNVKKEAINEGRIIVISEKGNSIRELARQLKVKPEIISKYNDNIDIDNELEEGIEIDLTEVFKNDRRKSYRNIYKAVIEQSNHIKSGKKGGPKMIPCSIVAWGLSTENDFFSYETAIKILGEEVYQSNQPFEDFFTNNYNLISSEEAEILDVIAFGTQQKWGGVKHYGIVFIKNNNGELWIFSKIGTNGPFAFSKIYGFGEPIRIFRKR